MLPSAGNLGETQATMEESDSIPISALQHFAFCKRQCALIHIERQWAENRLTAEGRVLHEKAHDEGNESRSRLRIARALPLQSMRLGIHGVADIVEFHLQDDGSWRPFPVEYKRGRPKRDPVDAMQLCAQALCLEEMLSVDIATGALFYGETRKRQDLAFDEALRNETFRTIRELRTLLRSGETPAPQFGPRCRSCSLAERCAPEAMAKSAARYLARMFAAKD